MKVDAWMPLYIADLIADTLHLNRAEFGSYVLLMCAYWRNKGPLDDDDRTLSNICRVTLSEWSATRSALAGFFQIENGKWSHKRIDAELQAALKLKEAKKRGAEATNRAKRHAQRTQSNPHSATESMPDSGVPSPKNIYINNNKGEQPVELPVGFPATKEAAVAHAAFVGCPPAFAEQTWNKAVSRGGHDAQNVPIRNFRAYLATQWSYEQNRQNKERLAPRTAHPKPHADRSAGTANEGRANDYSNLG